MRVLNSPSIDYGNHTIEFYRPDGKEWNYRIYDRNKPRNMVHSVFNARYSTKANAVESAMEWIDAVNCTTKTWADYIEELKL